MRKEYVKLFHLRDQPIVDCVRIFLSAFRLPGEAQQIDRILVRPRNACAFVSYILVNSSQVAFSEHCFANCFEVSFGVQRE